MVNPETWQPWLGLPHIIGADPAEGRGACCLRMAAALYRAAGRPFPDPDPFLELARRGQWGVLQIRFEKLSEPVEPGPLALTLLRNPREGLGIGIHVGTHLLMPHHRRGVVAVPVELLKPLAYRRPLEMA
jgi:hypothetical protein